MAKQTAPQPDSDLQLLISDGFDYLRACADQLGIPVRGRLDVAQKWHEGGSPDRACRLLHETESVLRTALMKQGDRTSQDQFLHQKFVIDNLQKLILGREPDADFISLIDEFNNHDGEAISEAADTQAGGAPDKLDLCLKWGAAALAVTAAASGQWAALSSAVYFTGSPNVTVGLVAQSCGAVFAASSVATVVVDMLRDDRSITRRVMRNILDKIIY